MSVQVAPGRAVEDPAKGEPPETVVAPSEHASVQLTSDGQLSEDTVISAADAPSSSSTTTTDAALLQPGIIFFATVFG